MTDEIKLTQQQGKGQRAEELLRNELLQETFKTLEADYTNSWKITPVNDTLARERLWTAVNILIEMQNHIKKVARDGKLASKDLANIKYLKP